VEINNRRDDIAFPLSDITGGGVDYVLETTGNVAIQCHSYDHQNALFDNLTEDLRQRVVIHTRRDREERPREWMQSRGKVFLSVAFNEGQAEKLPSGNPPVGRL